MALPDFPDYHKWGFSLAALNSDVYVTGGWSRAPRDTLINLIEHGTLESTLPPDRIWEVSQDLPDLSTHLKERDLQR